MISPTILLVDDDSDLLQAIGKRCQSLGLNVQHARNLLTATTVLEKCVPDIVCVDVEMPTGNGLRFCETIAADPRTAHVPIIVLTGRQDAVTIEACRRINAHYQFKTGDIWASLEPLLRRSLPAPRGEGERATAVIRPRPLPAHAVPPWPAQADASNKNRADAGKKNRAEAGNTISAEAVNSRSPAARQVVVADDDTDLVRLLAQRFSSLGCSVIGVNSALEAINVIHRSLPDLVVLDVNMPSGNGLSVCEMMASDERLRRIPVIILTGQADEKTIRRCHEMLVFYVQKGTDVWDRVEPLVRELLKLDAAPAETTPPPSQDSLMDAVFAMLGADADAETRPANEVENVPWVLCIDDDADFSDALQIRLEEYGVAMARAANGMEGFRLAFASPASAILLDFNMPNGQGDYILGRLKDNPVTKDIPVFMITGVVDKMLERRVTAMGVAGYFQKPVKFEALRDRLADYIDVLAQPAKPLASAHSIQ